MSHRIVLTPEAEAQLDALYVYLAGEASLAIATRYIEAVLEKIAGLAEFPHRGTPRDDIQAGMRTIPFRRRLTIAYVASTEVVRIAGVFYAGQDFEARLREE